MARTKCTSYVNRLGSLGLLAVLTIGSSAKATELPKQSILTLEAAQHVLRAAQKEAASQGWPGVIAVVDQAGLTIAMVRMDNAAVPGGVDLAPGKARTAALFRRPTSALEAAINGPRAAAITARGFVMMTGGVPIVEGGQIVGAIGVSADTPEHDELIAKAGIAALAQF
jgi:glc operon protein GlcG